METIISGTSVLSSNSREKKNLNINKNCNREWDGLSESGKFPLALMNVSNSSRHKHLPPMVVAPKLGLFCIGE